MKRILLPSAIFLLGTPAFADHAPSQHFAAEALNAMSQPGHAKAIPLSGIRPAVPLVGSATLESIGHDLANRGEHPFIAMKLYDKVAERSGFLVYRKKL